MGLVRNKRQNITQTYDEPFHLPMIFCGSQNQEPYIQEAYRICLAFSGYNPFTNTDELYLCRD